MVFNISAESTVSSALPETSELFIPNSSLEIIGGNLGKGQRLEKPGNPDRWFKSLFR